MNIVPVFYFISNNFGDALSPYIIRKKTNLEVAYVSGDSDITKYMVTGSILNHGNNNCIVWGCGIANKDDTVIQKDIRLVRGVLTAKYIKEQGIKFDETKIGDPALILSHLYNFDCEREYISIAPHYIDAYLVSKGNVDGLQWIDVNDSIENVIVKLKKSKIVFTSSLHIIIACHSYGIPVVWCKFSNYILGDGTKYYDHYLTMGVPEEDIFCLDLRNRKNFYNIFKNQIESHKSLHIPEKIISNILETFPI